MDIDFILKNIPDKRQDKNTTSLVMKKDIINFCGDKYLDKKCFEIGTSRGYTTRILSFLFEKVKTVDIDDDLITYAKNLNKDRDNIEYQNKDIYAKEIISSNNWWNGDGNVEKYDVFLIDAVHDKQHVIMDINTSFEKGTDDVVLIFDDYGLIPEVKLGIDEYINNGKLKVIKYIGEPKGNEPRVGIGKKLLDWEGIICQKN